MNVQWGQGRFLHVRMEATVLMASTATYVTAQALVCNVNGHRVVQIVLAVFCDSSSDVGLIFLKRARRLDEFLWLVL